MLMPMVIERLHGNERSYDLTSRLLEDRIVKISAQVNTQLEYLTTMQLLYLDSVDDALIQLYINSPGGSVHDGLAIYDQMKLCRSDIRVISTGMSASMGCFLTCMGTDGQRLATKHSFIMAHEVSSGSQGTVRNMENDLKHSIDLNQLLYSLMAERVGVSTDQLLNDTIRDKWMNASEALNYGKNGFIDGILTGNRNSDGKFEVLRRNDKLDYL